LTLQQEGHTIY